MSSYVQYFMSTVFDSGSLSIVLNQAVQVYCFTYAVLCLMTSILTMTNFIYADYLLNIKPIGLFSFVLFWSMKLWTSFDQWMVWINFAVAIYIALYFYDGCCNVSNELNENTQTTTRDGVLLVLVDIGLIIALVLLRKYSPQNEQQGLFGSKQNYLYLGLAQVLFGINLYRMRQRSLFPSLIAILFVTLTLVAKQLFLMKGFTRNIPFEAVIYLALVVDAEGRQFKLVQNKVLHHLFLTCVYFYGFVITNQRSFNAQYFMLGVAILMLLLNK